MRDYRQADPELLRQLDEARDSEASIAAAVSIRRRPGVPPDTTKVQQDVERAVARAGDAAGTEPSRVRVMPHLAVAYVEGPERLIRALLDQPEVTGAVAGGAGRPAEDPDSG